MAGRALPRLSALKLLARVGFRLRSSLWFVPAVVVALSVAAAIALIDAQAWVGDRLAQDWPRLFGAGAEGSRGMLSSIATSMVTVAGVVFSITMVTLSLSATQYSPRILRNFMRDRATQVVLGIFMGIFAYCLVVLRTVRGADELEFNPSLAVLGGMGYAFVGIGLLIYFIHHVAEGIQASNIAARIHDDTRASIDRLYPESLGAPAGDGSTAEALDVDAADAGTHAIVARGTGYVTSIDADCILEIAIGTGRLLRLGVSVGQFVRDGDTLARLDGTAPASDDVAGRLRSGIVLGRQRTEEQDAAYGLQQLADVAVKALSPGINDPTTACLCIDRLGALLRRLAARQFPEPCRRHAGRIVVIAPAPDFASLAVDALEPVIVHGRGNPQVADRLLEAITISGAATRDPARRRGLASLIRTLESSLLTAEPRNTARPRLRRARRLRRELETGGDPGDRTPEKRRPRPADGGR